MFYVFLQLRWSVLSYGARGGVVVKALRYKPVSLEFFSDIILPVALWPWGQLSL